ncbi:MAG: VOC family protein, partial [Sandaracinaceae bacterium]
EMGTYLMMKVGERSVGGMMQSPSPEVPQIWLSYVCVDDVDASAKQIETLGGTLINKPFSIPNIGRMVMATDPTGAVFALFKGETDDYGPDEPFNHGVCWHELMTDDLAKATKFYTALLGYTTENMGPDTVVLKQGDKMRGTLRNKPEMAKGSPNHWLVYFAVEDVENATKKATGLGGKVFMPATDVPNMGTFAVLADAQGGAFAVWKQTGPTG